MPSEPIDRTLRNYATALHQLAYTMPNGHEHELLQLARRMQETADVHFRARVHSAAGDQELLTLEPSSGG
jgi:hypothetical protein